MTATTAATATAAAAAPAVRSAARPTLRLGTRGSALALTQSQVVADGIVGARVELVTVTTAGDTDPRSLTQIGGTGVFAAALRTALLAGQVDLAVHSLKDLPVEQPAGLALAAIPVREDPADALVARDGLTFAELPAGARVGTGSPRRAAQLRAARPDLAVMDVRGNVDTRIAAVTSGRLDAVVLARAGLARLGRLAAVTDVFTPELLLPAPGQGALAVECREDGLPELLALLEPLEDAATRAATTAERAVLAGLGAGCSTPVGALAEPVPAGLRLRATVAGTITAETTGIDPLALGHHVAGLLLERGAQPYLDPPRSPEPISSMTPRKQ